MKSAPFICAILAAGAFTVPSFADTFGGWNSTRAGSTLNLVDGTGTTGLRADIANNFPGATITGTDTLTAAYLNTIDVAVLNSATGATSAVSGLSSTEQNNLLAFVEGGKGAVIFLDNDTFAAGVDAVNNSFTSPFGVHVTGTLIETQLASTLSSPITSPTAPFGAVSTMTTIYPGWFDNLGPNATDAADLQANSQSALAYIAPGAIAPGSGPVVFFSDSVFADGGGFSSNETLVENALAYADSGPVSAVPEPASLLIVGIGGAALVLRRRRTAI
jgi:hypothetical protein